MKAYHFLKDNMRGGYGNEPPWKIGEERDIGDNNLHPCKRGYHSSPSWYDALGYAMGNMACVVEVSKPIEKDETKQVSRKRKLIDARNAEKVLRAWGCDCAERALKKAKAKDERSWKVIRVARLFNDGKATKEELAAARAAAEAAAWAAAEAAEAAAWAAAEAAAEAAAWAARDAAEAARAAAWAVRDAAWAAAWAARDAAWAAADAAEAAALDAEIKWQRARLDYYMNKLFSGELNGKV